MAKADRVSLTFEADLAPLIRKLKEVPDLTGAEVRRATSALRKGTKELQKNARGAAQASRQAGDGVKRLGDASGDAESSLRAVAGVIGLVSPEAEQALASIAELGGGLEGVTRATELFQGGMSSVLRIAGPVGIAVAALGAAHFVLKKQVDQAEEAMRAAAKTAAQAQKVYGGTADVVGDLEQEFAILSGALTEQDAALEAQQLAIQQSFSGSRRALTRQIEALKEQKDAIRASGGSAEEMQAQLDAVNQRITIQTGTLNALNQREERALFLAEANSDLRNQEKTQRDQVADATNRQALALQALQEAQAAESAQLEKDLAIIFEQVNQRQRLKALQEELEPRTSFEEAESRINEQLRERTLILDEHDLLMGQTAASEAARQQIALDRNRQITEVQAEQQQFLEDQRQRFHDAELSRISIEEQRRRQMLQNAGMALATFAGGVADASRFASDKMAEDNKEAARRMFAVSKAAAISQAIINGALAITQSLAQLGPIFGPIAAAGVAASTAAQIGIISAEEPSFNDTPGVMSLPSGGSARFAPGDMVVAGKDLSDMRRQLDRAEPRRQAPTVQVIGIPLYEGRTYERARRDAYRRPGADSRALSALRRQGQGGW